MYTYMSNYNYLCCMKTYKNMNIYKTVLTDLYKYMSKYVQLYE